MERKKTTWFTGERRKPIRHARRRASAYCGSSSTNKKRTYGSARTRLDFWKAFFMSICLPFSLSCSHEVLGSQVIDRAVDKRGAGICQLSKKWFQMVELTPTPPQHLHRSLTSKSLDSLCICSCTVVHFDVPGVVLAIELSRKTWMEF